MPWVSEEYICNIYIDKEVWCLTYMCLCVCVCVCVHTCLVISVLSNSLDPVDCGPQVPLSMGFSRQEYWSGLPCSPPGDLPNPRMERKSPASPALQVDSLPIEPSGKTTCVCVCVCVCVFPSGQVFLSFRRTELIHDQAEQGFLIKSIKEEHSK